MVRKEKALFLINLMASSSLTFYDTVAASVIKIGICVVFSAANKLRFFLFSFPRVNAFRTVRNAIRFPNLRSRSSSEEDERRSLVPGDQIQENHAHALCNDLEAGGHHGHLGGHLKGHHGCELVVIENDTENVADKKKKPMR